MSDLCLLGADIHIANTTQETGSENEHSPALKFI